MEVNFPYVSLEVFYIFIIFMKITLSQDEEKSTLRLVQIVSSILLYLVQLLYPYDKTVKYCYALHCI